MNSHYFINETIIVILSCKPTYHCYYWLICLLSFDWLIYNNTLKPKGIKYAFIHPSCFPNQYSKSLKTFSIQYDRIKHKQLQETGARKCLLFLFEKEKSKDFQSKLHSTDLILIQSHTCQTVPRSCLHGGYLTLWKVKQRISPNCLL